MSTHATIIKHKIGLLHLADELENVSQACKVMGYSRDTFYRYKQAVEDGGLEALVEQSHRKPNLRNRVAPELEDATVALAVEAPALGQVRVSNGRRRRGQQISPAGVRGVWQRHGLETFKKRLKAGQSLAQKCLLSYHCHAQWAWILRIWTGTNFATRILEARIPHQVLRAHLGQTWGIRPPGQ